MNIKKSFLNIRKSYLNINKSFLNIKKYIFNIHDYIPEKHKFSGILCFRQQTNKVEYWSEMGRNEIESDTEMARNEIESDIWTSKMATGSHFVKKKSKICIDLKWPEMWSKWISDIQNGRRQPFCKKNLKKVLYWPEMAKNVIESDFRTSN